MGAGVGPRTRLRTFSLSTISTVSTSFILGLVEKPRADVPSELLPCLQDLSIIDHRWGNGGGGGDPRNGEPDQDEGVRGRASGRMDGERSRNITGASMGTRNRQERQQRAEHGQMPVAPEHNSHDHKKQTWEITDSEEKELNGEGKEHRQGPEYRENDGEIITAIWNAIDRKQPDAVGIQMCMDEAGRWRIAWGQLVD